GLVHVFDATPDTVTYVYVRGNEKDPDKSKPIAPAVPAALRGSAFEIKPVPLPSAAFAPDSREFVIKETRTAYDAAIAAARNALPPAGARVGATLLTSDVWSIVGRLPVMQLRDEQRTGAELDLRIAELRWDVFSTLLAVEAIDQKVKPDEWK